MLYEVCVETVNGSVKSVSIESESRKKAMSTARGLRFVSRKSKDPVLYVRRISEDEYFAFEDDFYYNSVFYGEPA